MGQCLQQAERNRTGHRFTITRVESPYQWSVANWFHG